MQETTAMQENHYETREPRLREEGARNGQAVDDMWLAAGALFRWRRFIIGVTALVAVVAIIISLLLPKWYEASVRVLPPENGGGGGLAAALLKGGPGSAASALLGGVSSDYARYLAILSSRRVLGPMVDEFDLVTVYELEDVSNARERALLELEQNVAFPVDEDYEFLSVVVMDKDPQRAADMANYMVQQLNDVNSELSSQNAANYRQFVEMRYNESQAALDSVLDATQAFQKKYGVLDLDVQTQAYFDNLATLQAGVTLAEIEYEALSAQLGTENPQVQARAQVAAAARRKVRSVLAGQEAVLPIAQEEMSDVARDFVDLKREAIVQGQMLEAIAPLYEQARFEEEKTVEAVQVVDQAVAPFKKSKPQRSVIVVVATLTGLMMATLFVLLYAWWQRRHVELAYRLRTSVEQSAPVRA